MGGAFSPFGGAGFGPFFQSAARGTKPFPFPKDEDIKAQVNKRVAEETSRLGFQATILTPPTGPGEPLLGKTTLLGI